MCCLVLDNRSFDWYYQCLFFILQYKSVKKQVNKMSIDCSKVFCFFSKDFDQHYCVIRICSFFIQQLRSVTTAILSCFVETDFHESVAATICGMFFNSKDRRKPGTKICMHCRLWHCLAVENKVDWSELPQPPGNICFIHKN